MRERKDISSEIPVWVEIIGEFSYYLYVLNQRPLVSYLNHTRVIGERSYSTKQSITFQDMNLEYIPDGEEMIETDMDGSELENFKREWEEKWNPSIREDEPRI